MFLYILKIITIECTVKFFSEALFGQQVSVFVFWGFFCSGTDGQKADKIANIRAPEAIGSKSNDSSDDNFMEQKDNDSAKNEGSKGNWKKIWPPDDNSAFYVTETPALTTQPLMTFMPPMV